MRSNEENVEVCIAAWKLLTERFPGATLKRAEGVASMFANLPLSFLNMSVVDRPTPGAAELREALAVAKERAKACPHGSLIALCDTWAPQEWERVISDEGLALAINTTGMETGRLLPPRRQPPALVYRRVTDDSTARDLAIINALAYAMPTELFDCMANMRLWHADSFGYVGYVGGQAVTAAAAFPVAGTVYIAFVATLPEAHGKGYAEAVMRHTIEQAQPAMGKSRLTLHASDMGLPVYKAMGFEPGARLVMLMDASAAYVH
jgi:ribosomal protein S18 acetylase RimI-like enzyme